MNLTNFKTSDLTIGEKELVNCMKGFRSTMSNKKIRLPFHQPMLSHIEENSLSEGTYDEYTRNHKPKPKRKKNKKQQRSKKEQMNIEEEFKLDIFDHMGNSAKSKKSQIIETEQNLLQDDRNNPTLADMALTKNISDAEINNQEAVSPYMPSNMIKSKKQTNALTNFFSLVDPVSMSIDSKNPVGLDSQRS